MSAEPWPCRLTGATMRMDGTPVAIDRLILGPWASEADRQASILAALAKRRDGGRAFVGDGLTLTDPLGRRSFFILEERCHPDGRCLLTLEREATLAPGATMAPEEAQA